MNSFERKKNRQCTGDNYDDTSLEQQIKGPGSVCKSNQTTLLKQVVPFLSLEFIQLRTTVLLQQIKANGDGLLESRGY